MPSKTKTAPVAEKKEKRKEEEEKDDVMDEEEEGEEEEEAKYVKKSKSTEDTGKELATTTKKVRRYRPGVRAHMEAKRLMKSTRGISSVKPILRLVRDLIAKRTLEDTGKPLTHSISFQAGLPKALAAAVDKYLVKRFELAACVASNATTKAKRTIKIAHYCLPEKIKQ